MKYCSCGNKTVRGTAHCKRCLEEAKYQLYKTRPVLRNPETPNDKLLFEKYKQGQDINREEAHDPS